MTYIDYLALVIALVFGIPLVAIFVMNGSQYGETQSYFLMYPGAELDFSYHFGLIQQAINRESYPTENPVFAGIPSQYPSLIHLGLAGIAACGNGPAVVTLWCVLPVFMLASATMGFIAVNRLSGLRTFRTTSLLAVAYIAFVLVRVDHFLLPQAQSIAFGLLSLLLYYVPAGRHRMWPQWIAFAAIAMLLTLSHTVSATVALMLTGAIVFFLIIRKKGYQLIPGMATGVIILIVFTLMNHYPKYPPKAQNISSEYLSQYFTTLVLPYIIPTVIGFVFLIKQRLVTPLALTGFGLIMLTIAYWAYGFGASSHHKIFFTLFNAPRFALFGLFLLLPYFRYQSLTAYLLPSLMFASILFYPNQVIRTMPTQIFGTGLSYPMKDVLLMHTELKPMTTASIISNYTDLGPAAFSGCPIYIEQPSYALYALDTVDESVANQRLADRTAFFSTYTPDERLRYMQQNRIGAAVVSGDLAKVQANNFLPKGSYTYSRGDQWAIYKLNDAIAAARLDNP